ncbi:MAG: Hpt domain-containing protein [Alphaproteobacteria bacterium]|nr:Hpt domain-containing protein [Alphaproteobacteria bacterium]
MTRPRLIVPAKLLSHAAGDEVVAREVLALFRDHAGDWAESVRAAQSLVEMRQASHRIVGAARGIGAEAVAALAATIERAEALEAGRAEAERLVPLMQALLAEIDMLLASAAQLGETGAGRGIPA